MIPYKQLSLADIFQDCQNKFENDKPAFLSLLEQHIDLDEIIPAAFYSYFYASTGRTRKYPLKAFLGDAAFDTLQLYKDLLTGDTFGNNRHFSKAYIPLNARSSLKNADYTINENGIPCCPLDASLPMKYEGISKLKSGFTRYKFVCPKIKWVYDSATKKYHRECLCDTPCTPSKSGRMVYIYPEKDLRAYPGTIRGTAEWDNTYKIRTVVEREINHIKENLCLAGRRTQNEKTLHADLILAGITQLITVVLADKIHHPEYVRSLKPLIA